MVNAQGGLKPMKGPVGSKSLVTRLQGFYPSSTCITAGQMHHRVITSLCHGSELYFDRR